MIKKESRNSMRKSRHERVRKNIFGTSATPRLNVFRSNTGIYAQIIDDETRTTICSASTLDKDLKIKNGRLTMQNMEFKLRTLSSDIAFTRESKTTHIKFYNYE